MFQIHQCGDRYTVGGTKLQSLKLHLNEIPKISSTVTVTSELKKLLHMESGVKIPKH